MISGLATISDCPLSLKELIIINVFAKESNLIDRLVKNYTRQGILQWYKILGSIDLLGNPVGLIDSFGTGVFEFLNEPRKGLIKGPLEFVGGVGKGVKSLVTHVVSGSFGAISKSSGALYVMVKDLTGQDGSYS